MRKEVKIEDKTYFIKKPGPRESHKAQIVYNKAFKEALDNGGILAEKMGEYLKTQGVWDDAREAESKSLRSHIQDLLSSLNKGGIPLSKARQIALEVAQKRKELTSLLLGRQSYDANCVEGVAQSQQFDFLVSCCVLNEDGSQVWPNVEAYWDAAEEKWAAKLAQEFSTFAYGLDDGYEQNLPENKFLIKYKFVDKDLNFINKDGHKVDIDGRLIDEDGRYIKYVDGQKVYVNRGGEEVDEEGNVKDGFVPFLDDDGNPIENV
jgi:hypothetical protein